MNKPHKHAEKIKAWADGAEIEYYGTVSDKWLDAGDNPRWFKNVEYRVKPQPKLVPFDTKEDAENLIGKAVVSKETGNTFLITGVSKVGEKVCINDYWATPEHLLREYTFLGGSPCGKCVEE